MTDTLQARYSRLKNEALAYARKIKACEREISEKINLWLPDTFIDAHAHSNLPEHVLSISPRIFGHSMSTFSSFSIEDSREFSQILHPGKKVFTLRFPHVFSGLDHKAANTYLYANCSYKDFVAAFGLYDNMDYTSSLICDPKTRALKMYYAYKDPPASHIYDIFPPAILETAQSAGVPIILHPPLPITKCLDQVKTLVSDFPSIKICIAHLGWETHRSSKLKEAYFELRKSKNVYLDTALVTSEQVIALALASFGPDRIIYGSDQPLNLIRANNYIHPQLGARWVTEFPYHWARPDEQRAYRHLALNATLMHWPPLVAIQKVVEEYPKSERLMIKNNIFYENAKRFYKLSCP